MKSTGYLVALCDLRRINNSALLEIHQKRMFHNKIPGFNQTFPHKLYDIPHTYQQQILKS